MVEGAGFRQRFEFFVTQIRDINGGVNCHVVTAAFIKAQAVNVRVFQAQEVVIIDDVQEIAVRIADRLSKLNNLFYGDFVVFLRKDKIIKLQKICQR